MDNQLVIMSREEVRHFLEWEWLIDKIEDAFRAISDGRAHQKSRISLPHKNGVFSMMPGFVENKITSGQNDDQLLVCKILNIFNRTNLPSITANIFIFDVGSTGNLKCIMDGEEITAWRTAAASAVVTKHIYLNEVNHKRDILAVFGGGVQAKHHILCYQHLFKFKEIRIWSRKSKQGEQLVKDLKLSNVFGNIRFIESRQECVTNANVLITTTTSTVPLVEYRWLKSDVHIVAVGVSPAQKVNELDLEIYQNAWICIDSIETAKTDLPILKDANAVISAEVGDIVMGKVKLPSVDQKTVFHSLGLAVEDVVTAETIYKKYISKLKV